MVSKTPVKGAPTPVIHSPLSSPIKLHLVGSPRKTPVKMAPSLRYFFTIANGIDAHKKIVLLLNYGFDLCF